MTAKLDILAYEALNADKHLRRLTNAEYLDTLKRTVWKKLNAEQQGLYEKLLAADRSRYVALADFDKLMHDDHESRSKAYKAQLESLSVKCVDALMEKSGIPADKVKLVITNHTVGGICPPISSLIINRLGLSPAVQAIDMAFMGCASAVWGAELAARLLKPGELAVVLSAELTSAATNLAGEPQSLVANTVFGDGVGAFLLGKPGHGFTPRFKLHDFSGSLVCDDDGLNCIRYEPNSVFYAVNLKETIPQVAGRGIKHCIEPIVRRRLVTLKQKIKYLFDRKIPDWQKNIDYFVLHTAGNKILKGVKESLKLTDKQVAHNFACFARHGNTSSASIYYALQELERTQKLIKGDRLLILAYGSGFMTKCMYATVA